jgi:hypothetical protein
MMKSTVENFIGVFENAFSKELCEHFIDSYEKSVALGYGLSRQEHDKAPKTAKDDVSVFPNVVGVDARAFAGEKEFNNTLWEKCFPVYLENYAILDTIDPFTVYQSKIQKTVVGGGYHVWHCEAGTRLSANRLLFFILYLNDVEEGGETEFLYQHKRVKPKQGTLVVAPAAFTHTHRGNPPLSNTKYILTGWIEL